MAPLRPKKIKIKEKASHRAKEDEKQIDRRKENNFHNTISHTLPYKLTTILLTSILVSIFTEKKIQKYKMCNYKTITYYYYYYYYLQRMILRVQGPSFLKIHEKRYICHKRERNKKGKT